MKCNHHEMTSKKKAPEALGDIYKEVNNEANKSVTTTNNTTTNVSNTKHTDDGFSKRDIITMTLVILFVVGTIVNYNNKNIFGTNLMVIGVFGFMIQSLFSD